MRRLYQFLAGTVLIVAVFLVAFRAGVAAGAQNGVPGSINDPLITKSYLDERLAQLGGGGVSSTGGMTRIDLVKGDIVIGQEGTTFVLVYGSAFVDGGGMVNITAGELPDSGMSVPKYHTFLAIDGSSGFQADSSAIVYVSGKHDVSRGNN